MATQKQLFRYLTETVNSEIPKQVTNVTIDASVKIVDKGAFSRKRKLVEVLFASGYGEGQTSNLQVIGYDAFYNCRLLAQLELPLSVKEIRDDAFHNARSLVQVRLPHGLKWMGERTFADCTSLKHIQIPSTVEELGFRVFVNCQNLVSVELADGLRVIGEKAFEHCISLKNMAIPLSVEVVEPNAFTNCMRLERRFPYTAELHEALRHRFDDLPLHRFCYQRAFSRSDEAAMDDTNIELSVRPTLDCFGMTPLHLLALSTEPNLTLAKYILNRLPNRIQLVRTKDRWDQSVFDYLFLHSKGKDNDARELMKHIVEVTILQPTRSLGLDQWREDIWNRVNVFQSDVSEGMAEQIHTTYEILSRYLQMECYSLLELAVWKAKMDENSGVDRQGCRIQSGIQVIVPNVMFF